jgi:hypothetical protein
MQNCLYLWLRQFKAIDLLRNKNDACDVTGLQIDPLLNELLSFAKSANTSYKFCSKEDDIESHWKMILLS